MSSKKPATGSQVIHLKRVVTIKSLVTPLFREKASKELGDELAVIEGQLNQLENQYQASLHQLNMMAQQGQNIAAQLDGLNKEVMEKRNQLNGLKNQVSTQLGNLDKLEDGTPIVTGQLDNFVEIKVGDNIYDKIRNAEIIIEDGLVKEIKG
jgi:esterase/lipase